MRSITIKAPAKINLSLDITGRREDGYHFLRTVMQAVTLFDAVTVSLTEGNGITVTCDAPDIPCDHRNIAWKAAAAFLEENNLPTDGISIDIQKNIPSQAGLGGGSADGAAVIYALNHLFACKNESEKLWEIGLKAGADVPFCIMGGTALAEGIGEILSPIDSSLSYHIVIAKPAVGVSTAAAYQKFDEAGIVRPPMTESLIGAVIAGNLKEASPLMSNVFETLLPLPEVSEIETLMLDHGAFTAVMSGSGSAVYGIFATQFQAEKCLLSCKKRYPFACLCQPYPFGCTVIKNSNNLKF